jgi:hypothetical protein
MKQLRSRGNLIEYLLPALVIGVGLIGTGLLMVNQMAPDEGVLKVYQAQSTQTVGGKTLVTVKGFGQNPYLQSFGYQTASGEWVQIPDFPMDIPGLIEVDGGHGTTEKLIAAMDRFVEALIQAKEITPAEGNLIKQLANKGHDLGHVQNVAETLAANCGSNTQCMMDVVLNPQHPLFKTLVLNGISFPEGVMATRAEAFFSSLSPEEMYSANQLFPHLGVNKLLFGNNQKAFLAQYHDIHSKVPLSPASAKVLSYLTKGIFSASLASIQAVNLLGRAQTSELTIEAPVLSELSTRSPTALNELAAKLTKVNFSETGQSLSASIHKQSAQICQVGDGQDTGVACR